MASSTKPPYDGRLPGEIVVAQAHKAQHLLHYTDQESAVGVVISGTLTCTNYCFHFEPDTSIRHMRLGQYAFTQLVSSQHVPLGCVKELHMIVSGRRKVLEGHTTLPKKITDIDVICKDLRRMKFSVKLCNKNEASSILNALVRHTHPSSVSLLFAFDYARATQQERDPPGNDSPPLFLNALDWQRELTRLGVTGDQWRISEANKEFLICDSLCPYIVVPANTSDSTLDYVASLHHGYRLPVWCWSHPHTGVSLTRGAAPSIDDQSEAPDPNYMHAVSMARHIDNQVENKRPATMDITKACGTVWDLRTAFNHMQELCMPESSQELAGLDKKWLAGLDTAGWLHMVRHCLHVAKKTVEMMCIERRPVFLQEEEGRDLSCVVSSLAQLMMDPYFRSIPGFQCLVQKEWVAMGHPFTSRHRLILPTAEGTTEPVEAPTFLLFLDCVWQLSVQFPSAFEFSESYLLHLHDIVYSCLYGTFVFDSPKACLQASLQLRNSRFFTSDEGVVSIGPYEGLLVSAWGLWRDSLSQEEREHSLNPFYYIFGSSEARYDYQTSDPLPMYSQFGSIFDATTPIITVGGSYGLYDRQSPVQDLHVTSSEKDHYQMGLLLPETSSCSLRPWLGFFLRYIPDFQTNLQQQQKVREREAMLVKDVRRLKDALNELELSIGSMASDLTSFIGAVLAARELEKRKKLSLCTEGATPPRSRLSEIVVPFEDPAEKEKRNAEIARPTKTLPPHTKSLAEFTETLYSYSGENDSPTCLRTKDPLGTRASSPLFRQSLTPTGSGRSPITKTRLRVTRTESTEQSGLSSRWGGSSGPAPGHIPLLPNKILIKHSTSLEEEGEGRQDEEGEGRQEEVRERVDGEDRGQEQGYGKGEVGEREEEGEGEGEDQEGEGEDNKLMEVAITDL